MAGKEWMIGKYIDQGPGPMEARLEPSGVAVWAIIGYLRAVEGNIDRVAKDYDIGREEVEAAIEYYETHKGLIDARLAMNVA